MKRTKFQYGIYCFLALFACIIETGAGQGSNFNKTFVDNLKNNRDEAALRQYSENKPDAVAAVVADPANRFLLIYLIQTTHDRMQMAELYKLLHASSASDKYIQSDLAYIEALQELRTVQSGDSEKRLTSALSVYDSIHTLLQYAAATELLAGAYLMSDKYERSLSTYLSAERLFTKLGLHENANNIRINHAHVLLEAGNHADGIYELIRALKEAIANNREYCILSGYSALAIAYENIGRYDLVLPIAHISLEMARKKNNLVLQYNALTSLSTCYVKSYRDTTNAIAYLDTALAIVKKLNIPAYYNDIYKEYARYNINYGDLEAADDYIEKLERNNFDRTELLTLKSDRAWYADKYADAYKYDTQILELLRQQGETEKLMKKYDNIGVYLIDNKKYKESVPYFRKSLSLLEEQLNKLDFGPSYKRPLLKNEQQYNSLAGAFLELGMPDSAYYYAERGKGKTALDQIAGNYFGKSSFVAGELRERYSAIEDSIGLLEDKLYGTPSGHSLQFTTAIEQLNIRKRRLQDEILRNTPMLETIKNPPVVSPGEVRSRHLGPDDLLVSFSVADDKVNVFALTKEEFRTFRIPVGINSLYKRCDSLFRLPSQQTMGILAPKFDVRTSNETYTLLFSRLRDLLAKKSNLIVIPDRCLYKIPFEALVTDASTCRNRYDTQRAKYLVESHNISYAVSIGLYVYDKKRPAGHAERGLLALGNPELHSKDVEAHKFYFAALRGDTSQRGSMLPPLLYAAMEAHNIDAILRSSSSTILTGAEATKRAFLRHAASYSILHLAAHNLIDDDHPLESAFYLSGDGSGQDRGILTAREISRMKLNAQLAVLSACNSGSGAFIASDGVMSMGRAFWASGVPAVVMSLWSVDDESTSGLMERFYHYLKAGKDKAYALSQAKRDMLASGDRNPYYWAGFVLQGNNQPIKINERLIEPGMLYAVSAIAALITAGLLLYIYKRRRLRTSV